MQPQRHRDTERRRREEPQMNADERRSEIVLEFSASLRLRGEEVVGIFLRAERKNH